MSKPTSSYTHRTSAGGIERILSLIHHSNRRIYWSIHPTHTTRLHLQIQYMPFPYITTDSYDKCGSLILPRVKVIYLVDVESNCFHPTSIKPTLPGIYYNHSTKLAVVSNLDQSQKILINYLMDFIMMKLP